MFNSATQLSMLCFRANHTVLVGSIKSSLVFSLYNHSCAAQRPVSMIQNWHAAGIWRNHYVSDVSPEFLNPKICWRLTFIFSITNALSHETTASLHRTHVGHLSAWEHWLCLTLPRFLDSANQQSQPASENSSRIQRTLEVMPKTESPAFASSNAWRKYHSTWRLSDYLAWDWSISSPLSTLCKEFLLRICLYLDGYSDHQTMMQRVLYQSLHDLPGVLFLHQLYALSEVKGSDLCRGSFCRGMSSLSETCKAKEGNISQNPSICLWEALLDRRWQCRWVSLRQAQRRSSPLTSPRVRKSISEKHWWQTTTVYFPCNKLWSKASITYLSNNTCNLFHTVCNRNRWITWLYLIGVIKRRHLGKHSRSHLSPRKPCLKTADWFLKKNHWYHPAGCRMCL